MTARTYLPPLPMFGLVYGVEWCLYNKPKGLPVLRGSVLPAVPRQLPPHCAPAIVVASCKPAQGQGSAGYLADLSTSGGQARGLGIARPAGAGTFMRQATGLVRQASTLDTFIYN